MKNLDAIIDILADALIDRLAVRLKESEEKKQMDKAATDSESNN
ncbi:hypothetical protein [Pusillibacter faecalis]|nr:hypothetical protein [Pusillibacter faecalis]